MDPQVQRSQVLVPDLSGSPEAFVKSTASRNYVVKAPGQPGSLTKHCHLRVAPGKWSMVVVKRLGESIVAATVCCHGSRAFDS